MNIITDIKMLRKALKQGGIQESSYSLDNDWPDDAYVLSQKANVWKVYYSERGVAIGKKQFDSEKDACQYLYQQLLNDQTTRNS
jgi:hypothetical protein